MMGSCYEAPLNAQVTDDINIIINMPIGAWRHPGVARQGGLAAPQRVSLGVGGLVILVTRCVDWKSNNMAWECTAVPSVQDEQVRKKQGFPLRGGIIHHNYSL